MAILFVHGVNTRRETIPDRVATYIGRYVIGGRLSSTHVTYAYWGDLGGRYRLGGISRPRTLFTRQGADHDASVLATTAGFVDVLASLPDERRPDDSVASSGYAGGIGSRPATAVRLSEIQRSAAIQYLVLAAERQLADDEQLLTEVLAAFSDLEDDDEAWHTIVAATDGRGELAAVQAYLGERLDTGAYATQGSGRLRRFLDTAGEGLRRVASAPAAALSTGLGELRPLLDGLQEEFIGDVFTYLDGREPTGTVEPQPVGFAGPPALWETICAVAGPIPRTVIVGLLDAAAESPAGEPLVVITHSMGGQIVYDMITTFLPRLSDALADRGVPVELPHIDLWCATASQVGLFEELSLFLASDPKLNGAAPFPGRFLGTWWNVWDRNDLLSYTAKGIVDGVDDEEYSSGRSFIGAHSAYLDRPGFFKRLRTKVDALDDGST